MTIWEHTSTEIEPRQLMRQSKIEFPDGFIVLPDSDGDPAVVMILKGKKGRKILVPMPVVDSMLQEFLETEVYRHSVVEMREWKKKGMWKAKS